METPHEELTGLAGQILEDMKKPAKKLSEKQIASLQAIGETEKLRKTANKKFVTDFNKLPFLNPAIVATILRRIRVVPLKETPGRPTHRIPEDFDRMALKALACLRRGWTISEPHDLIFFGELTEEEACMTEKEFFKHLEGASRAASISRSKPIEHVKTIEIRRCKSGKKCMRFEKRKPAPAEGKGEYCSPACGASDRARAKRALSAMATSPAVN